MEKFDCNEYAFTFGADKVEISLGGDSSVPAYWVTIPLVGKVSIELWRAGGIITIESKVAIWSLLASSSGNALGRNLQEDKKVRLRVTTKGIDDEGNRNPVEVTLFNANLYNVGLDFAEAPGSFRYEFEVEPASFDEFGNSVENQFGYMCTRAVPPQEPFIESMIGV